MTFSQQITSSRLLQVAIGGAKQIFFFLKWKKVISLVSLK